MKKCTVCKLEKSLDQFRKDKSRKDGIHCTCNECNKRIQKAWYERNRDKARCQANANYALNKKEISERRKQDRKNNPAKYTAANKRRYDPQKSKLNSWKQAGIKGMTTERYNDMLLAQNFSCAICRTHQKKLKRKLSVDHNHQTGKVRGLLCDACNRGIGYLKESLTILEDAKNYLICHKTIG